MGTFGLRKLSAKAPILFCTEDISQAGMPAFQFGAACEREKLAKRVFHLPKQLYRTRQHFSCNIESTVSFGTHTPFNQSKGTVFYFDTGDASRMYTASGIVIISRFFWQDRSVGMTGDQGFFAVCCPFIQTFFGFMFYMVILCGTGRIQDAEVFQRTPEIADKKLRKRPEGRVQKTCLMPMCQI